MSEPSSPEDSQPSTDTEPILDFDLERKFPQFKGWEQIGFHRNLGAELWNMVLKILEAVLVLIIMIYLTPILNPFPEISGYSGVAWGLFSVVYTVFDTATNFGINNFIAENRLKNPAKMMEYIRFFIWYQCITGLIQVTILSMVILFYFNQTAYAYLLWLCLLHVQKQWPSMLGIYRGCIDGFQYYHWNNLMGFLQGQVVGLSLNIGFIMLGRWYGTTYPQIGLLMGIAIFSILGGYVNDIIFFIISSWYFGKLLKTVNYRVRDTWSTEIGKDVIKRCVLYGVQSSVIPIISGFVGTFSLYMYLNTVPGYTSYIALVGIGNSLSSVVGQFGGVNYGPALSESYANKKKHLSEFYVSYGVKWRLYFQSVQVVSIIAVFPVMSYIFTNISGLEFWASAIVFFIPGLLRKMFDPFIGLGDTPILSTFHIRDWVIIRAVEECFKVACLLFFLYGIKLFQNGGSYWVLVFMFSFADIIPIMLKTLYCIHYINKKILKIRIYWTSSVIIPIVSALPIIPVALLWINYLFYPMVDSIGLMPAICISILSIYLVQFIILFIPITGILGAWDDYSFFVFKKAVQLSGPSKPFFAIVLKSLQVGIRIGKKIGLHGRFAIPYKQAHQEIYELMKLKAEGKLEIKIAEDDEKK
jgi:hypothetical protein